MGDVKKNDKIEVKGLFELESCPRNSICCTQEIDNINQNHNISMQFAENKEFVAALHYKKEAFKEVIYINRPSCVNCANFFKYSIYKSTLKITEELKQKAKGVLSRSKYKKQYILALDILAYMEKHFDEELRLQA